jgi:NitT/TauT family transport system ATP-binding protein
VFTSNPGTIKREYAVDIPRPRDPFRIHETPGFPPLYEALWEDIRAEIRSDIGVQPGSQEGGRTKIGEAAS